MLAATIIGSVLAYLTTGIVVGGVVAYREDPHQGRADEDARVAAGLCIALWPLILVIMVPHAGAMRLRQYLVDRKVQRALPEARVR